MLRARLRTAFTFLLVAFSIPLLSVSFLIAALCAVVAAILPGLRKHSYGGPVTLPKLRDVDQFHFREAVAAYEELIGAYAWRQP